LLPSVAADSSYKFVDPQDLVKLFVTPS
jgi:hypothetical protein